MRRRGQAGGLTGALWASVGVLLLAAQGLLAPVHSHSHAEVVSSEAVPAGSNHCELPDEGDAPTPENHEDCPVCLAVSSARVAMPAPQGGVEWLRAETSVEVVPPVAQARPDARPLGSLGARGPPAA